ncbi:hypothetical protein B0H16DRAFT_1700430 [Mycena metata]|uniref:Uncharacterized protein n=1 Tax=Mycena metata TaxID=1033252 RepID=A0AAD7HEX0_9AGAR|nr:hypothetical protein B0H16DRAFT_1700430 [Mycena metata]
MESPTSGPGARARTNVDESEEAALVFFGKMLYGKREVSVSFLRVGRRKQERVGHERQGGNTAAPPRRSRFSQRRSTPHAHANIASTCGGGARDRVPPTPAPTPTHDLTLHRRRTSSSPHKEFALTNTDTAPKIRAPAIGWICGSGMREISPMGPNDVGVGGGGVAVREGGGAGERGSGKRGWILVCEEEGRAHRRLRNIATYTESQPRTRRHTQTQMQLRCNYPPKKDVLARIRKRMRMQFPRPPHPFVQRPMNKARALRLPYGAERRSRSTVPTTSVGTNAHPLARTLCTSFPGHQINARAAPTPSYASSKAPLCARIRINSSAHPRRFGYAFTAAQRSKLGRTRCSAGEDDSD